MNGFLEDFYEAWVDHMVNSRPLRSFTNNQSRTNVREILQMNENLINNFMELGRQLTGTNENVNVNTNTNVSVEDNIDINLEYNNINDNLSDNNLNDNSSNNNVNHNSNYNNNLSYNNPNDNSIYNNPNYNSSYNNPNDNSSYNNVNDNLNTNFNINTNVGYGRNHGNLYNIHNQRRNYFGEPLIEWDTYPSNNVSNIMNNIFGMFFDSLVVPVVPGISVDDLQDVKVTITDEDFNRFNKITINKNNKQEIKNDICNICMDEYNIGDTLVILPCDHDFHIDCIKNWLCNEKVTCPNCRKDVRN